MIRCLVSPVGGQGPVRGVGFAHQTEAEQPQSVHIISPLQPLLPSYPKHLVAIMTPVQEVHTQHHLVLHRDTDGVGAHVPLDVGQLDPLAAQVGGRPPLILRELEVVVNGVAGQRLRPLQLLLGGGGADYLGVRVPGTWTRSETTRNLLKIATTFSNTTTTVLLLLRSAILTV